MRKLISGILVLFLILVSVIPVFAEDGKVIYDGNAQEFIFAPGSAYSPTDLFPNFKGVMPGDELTQAITVRNDASKEVKVKIYMRSLGEQAGTQDFLAQLGLRVAKAEDNEMAYMFDASADQTAQLTDWVLLGTLYSGGEVNLNVILNVPYEMGNEFSSAIGYLDWEFKVEEYPIESTDPEPPNTGDTSNIWLWVVSLFGSLAAIFLLIFWRRKDRENRQQTVKQ